MTSRTVIAFPGELWAFLTTRLREPAFERMAFGSCGVSGPSRGRRYSVRELDIPDDAEYRSHGPAHVALRAEHAARRAVRARECRAFLDAHSHPFAAEPWPSLVDDRNAIEQHRCLQTWSRGMPLIRMILCGGDAVWAAVQRYPGGPAAAVDEIHVLAADRLIRIIPANAAAPAFADRPSEARTRQVVGACGIREHQAARVALVGLGGTGSVAGRLLAGAGIGELYCIDDDVVEPHNAPRLWYYAAGDEGRFKVAAAVREILRSFPDGAVEAIAEPFPGRRALRALSAATIVLSAVDSREARYSLACWCARRLLPLVDVGCGGRREDGGLTALGWQVRLQTAGSPCLACLGLDTRGLEDPETTRMKQKLGYIEGGAEIGGELATLTARAAADAVDVVLRYLTGYAPVVPRHVRGDMLRFRSVDASDAYPAIPGCPLCGGGPDSIAGTGVRWPGAPAQPPDEGFSDAVDD